MRCLVPVSLALLLYLGGCSSPRDDAPTHGDLVALRTQLSSISANQSRIIESQTRIERKLDEVRLRRIWLPENRPPIKPQPLPAPTSKIVPKGSEHSVVVSPQHNLPDIKAAIGHALQAAADLCGRDKVSEFFQDMVSGIVKKHLPLDVGGAVNKKCRSDADAEIEKLLNQ